MTTHSLTRILEWGPASHDPANPFSIEKCATAALDQYLDRRTETAADDDRPDDN